jgi:murein DD-endopeptidase MepM/ murein hydrolase activator NlpD
MRKKLQFRFLLEPLKEFAKEFFAFSFFLSSYTKRKILVASVGFEKQKNRLVRFFIMKRGRYNRPFLHIITMIVLGIGVLIAPILADTYPLFTSNAQDLTDLSNAQVGEQSISVGENVFRTQISDKPRDKVIVYTVQKGDTLSTIAGKFGISTDTVKWANDLTSDNITVGDTLNILPVTGILHKVVAGETVFTIAKKYDTEPQKIVDFPFNDFANPETFSLVAGQTLVVPDGVKPSERPAYVAKRQTYVVSGPVAISNAGFTWPSRGGISQFASWYHMALDITAPFGSPILASQDGRVSVVTIGSWDGGYGNNVWIDNGAGLASHYAHMSRVFVSPGQAVIAGKTVIGEIGLTGRTTGAHVHFEIRQNGVLVNPLPYLQ